MPIVISRKTREVTSAPVLTQEQTNQLWEKLVKNYLDMHPEVLQERSQLLSRTAEI